MLDKNKNANIFAKGISTLSTYSPKRKTRCKTLESFSGKTSDNGPVKYDLHWFKLTHFQFRQFLEYFDDIDQRGLQQPVRVLPKSQMLIYLVHVGVEIASKTLMGGLIGDLCRFGTVRAKKLPFRFGISVSLDFLIALAFYRKY